RQYSLDAKFLAQQRQSACFPDKKDLETALGAATPEERNRLSDPKVVATTSANFRATIIVTLGTNEFTLYSHLVRSPQGDVSAALWRSFGTDKEKSMSEALVIRLGGDPAAVQYLLVDAAGGRLGAVIEGPITQAAPLCVGRRVVVVAPAVEVVLATPELPA